MLTESYALNSAQEAFEAKRHVGSLVITVAPAASGGRRRE